MSLTEIRLSRAKWMGRCCVVTAASMMLTIAGCGYSPPAFSSNLIYLKRQESETGKYTPGQQQDIVDALTALFGTPDEPFFPAVEGVDEVLQVKRLERAAGSVGSDELGRSRGLYREHCVHCHGVTGDGRGPTAAFLNPYPRDFTKGQFKFKSTPIGVKPTTEDLRRTLVKGIPGTAMPSFALLSEGEINALIDYVKYLSIRGEVERQLMVDNSDQFFVPLDPDATPDEREATLESNQSLREEFFAPSYLIEEALAPAVAKWQSAESMATPVPERPAVYDRASEEFDPAELAASIERGRKLYYSNEAQCAQCHGPAQLGDGQTTDYDDWTKEFFDWQKTTDESYGQKMSEFLALGGLPPRNVLPRNLRSGIYRGGRRPVDIFWRIHNGIDGSGMPESNKAALKNEDHWDLVNYVLSLPYEQASRPGVDLPVNTKEVK